MNKDSQRIILYGAWKNMEYRCYNYNHEFYNDYGGRGIEVCTEWLEFDNFFRWAVENGHKKGLTLERIDNDSNYSPKNCKWASMEEQNYNKRNINFVTIDGVTRNAYEWCEIYNLNYFTFLTRYNTYGWDAIKAITTPVKRRNSKGFQKRVQ